MRALLFLISIFFFSNSAAQSVIRIVVPFAAGGVQDIIARSFNAELGQLLGRTVIVENRTGAGGTIGNASVAKAAPDGSTLILSAASHTITGPTPKKSSEPHSRRARLWRSVRSK